MWPAFILAEILTTASLLAFIARKNRRWPKTWADVLSLPRELTAGETKPFAKSASSMEEIMAVSEEARLFLLGSGASGREAMLMALAIEEMGGNIIRWGFGDGQKHSIDVAIRKNERWSLRIRDDCQAFDPKKWLEIHQAEDPAKNIGIRAICAMAEDVRYSRTLGLNYLFICL